MCLAAAALIATCVGYLPSSGSAVQVTRDCVHQFSAHVRRRAVQCAREHRVSWTVRQ